jgi:hypothetical protein
MQIYELTQKKNTQVDEGVFDTIGGAVGKTVSGVKNIGSTIASPFKDVAQGYKTGRMDQTISMLADKMNRAWQQYSVQWAKSQGGQYAAPGKSAPAPAGTQAAGTQAAGGATTTPPGQTKTSAKSAPFDLQKLQSTIQSLDNKQLTAIGKMLSQRVGPDATMNALKKPTMTEAQLNELGWQDVKNTASNIGTQIKQGVQLAPQFGKQVAKGYQAAAKPVMKAIKAAPGAIATGAGATAGAIAGMPARAGTAYRGAKAAVSGPTMTVQELQSALARLTTAQAQKLFAFVQQIQAARKAGLKEGLTPTTLLPGYEQALKAFVQKNLLSGMQYSRLQNAQQFDDLIKQLTDPANDSASAQKDLWNKITLAASVAQQTPATAGGQAAITTGSNAAATSNKSTTTDDPQLLIQPVQQALNQATPAGTLKAMGSILRQGFTNNNASLSSTGEPAVDALLMSMGFQTQ